MTKKHTYINIYIHTYIHTYTDGTPNARPVPGKGYVDIFPVPSSEILMVRLCMYACMYVYVDIFSVPSSEVLMVRLCMYVCMYGCMYVCISGYFSSSFQ